MGLNFSLYIEALLIPEGCTESNKMSMLAKFHQNAVDVQVKFDLNLVFVVKQCPEHKLLESITFSCFGQNK